ncbi:MAG TPA: tetratricopeptide repeat protein [Steroidobacteraceae bacterium]|nr:tetratricopeptide repeat protein [Steroidobacteraceae bacterium]
MHPRPLVTALIATAVLAGCTLFRPPPPVAPGSSGTQAGTSQPAQPAQPAPPAPPAAPEVPPPPPAAPPRQFHLGSATSALVAQAHQQAASGDTVQAAATLERALRIEPENPLVWIELGRVRLAENNPAQANAMGRKALALATGDPSAQSSAWHLIADALRARGDNAGAAEADGRAASLAPH